MKTLHILILLLLVGVAASAQKPAKVWSNSILQAMDSKLPADIDKYMDEAVADFTKILTKNPNDALSQFGLSVVYSYDTYTRHNYFEAWKYFRLSEQSILQISEEDKAVLDEYFFKQDKKRRGRTLAKNIEWERKLVEEKLIKFVREENNLNYANQFITEFPNSKYYENVIHIRNYIEFRKAEDAGTVEDMNRFVEKYPDAAQVTTAKEIRNRLAYKQALDKNSLSALKDFVATYTGAPQVEEAKKVMGVLAFEEAAKSGAIEILEHYMAEYPNSSKMPDAKMLKRQWVFEWAKKVNSIDAYNQFVAMYPEGEMYVDIFNLKADALGQQVLLDFPVENYKMVKIFDNQNLPERGGDVALRTNGELLLVTNSYKSKDEMTDSWLLGLNAEGKMLWNKFLGNEFDDQVNKVWISPTNEIYVAGMTNAIKDSIKGKAWMYKLDAQGKNIFNRKLEGSEVMDFAVYPDGKMLVADYTIQPGDTTSKSYITKVNEAGKKLWERSYTCSDTIYSILLHPDRTAFIAAETWLVALDENGYLVWDKTLGPDQKATSVILNEAGQIVFAGTQGSGVFAMAFDGLGNKIWEMNQPVEMPCQIKRITPLADLSVILSGTTLDNKILLLKIDHTGKLVTTKEFSTSNGIQLNGVAGAGGNFVLISATRLGPNPDVVVFKMSF